MKGDIIECLNCGKKFKDDTKQTDKKTEAGNTYQWTGQDSREGKFENMCPFCYGTSTRNTHEKAKRRQKFIYLGKHSDGDKHAKSSKHIKRPNLDTEYIADEVLGNREECDVSEDRIQFGIGSGRTIPQAETQSAGNNNLQQTSLQNFVAVTGGTFDTSPVKSFTPIELMERKLEAQHKELLSPPDNFKRYKGWRYDKRLKK
jgi:hypothetical protein